MSFFLDRLLDNPEAPNDNAAGGTFTLGGTNSSLFTGDIEFLPFPSGTRPSFWLLNMQTITVNGQTVQIQTGDAALSAIDTGTTLVGGPTNDVKAIWAAVPGSSYEADGQYAGFYTFPCNTEVTITLSFGGKAWTISPLDMNLGEYEVGKCLGGIFDLGQGTSIEGGNGNPSWIVGGTFLKNVYSVFRADPPAVGFAALAPGAQNNNPGSVVRPSPSATGGGSSSQNTPANQASNTVSGRLGTSPIITFRGPQSTETSTVGQGGSSGSTSSGAIPMVVGVMLTTLTVLISGLTTLL
jgi:cathepsin D